MARSPAVCGHASLHETESAERDKIFALLAAERQIKHSPNEIPRTARTGRRPDDAAVQGPCRARRAHVSPR